MLRIQPCRLVLVGSVLVDILMYIDHLPERGGDFIARQALLTSGGGFNVLVGAARLGMAVAWYQQGAETATGHNTAKVAYPLFVRDTMVPCPPGS